MLAMPPFEQRRAHGPPGIHIARFPDGYTLRRTQAARGHAARSRVRGVIGTARFAAPGRDERARPASPRPRRMEARDRRSWRSEDSWPRRLSGAPFAVRSQLAWSYVTHAGPRSPARIRRQTPGSGRCRRRQTGHHSECADVGTDGARLSGATTTCSRRNRPVDRHRTTITADGVVSTSASCGQARRQPTRGPRSLPAQAPGSGAHVHTARAPSARPPSRARYRTARSRR